MKNNDMVHMKRFNLKNTQAKGKQDLNTKEVLS